jgi:hypothetical protein
MSETVNHALSDNLFPARLFSRLSGGVAGRRQFRRAELPGESRGVFPLWLNRDFEKVRIKLRAFKARAHYTYLRDIILVAGILK